MRSLRHLLPSAGHLIVFEAAGRLGSFTEAGRELGMSQAAVSYAVRALEEQLGVKLFQRGHRRVALTDAGARFFADVTQGLGLIRKSAETLRAAAHGPQVTLAASTAFASFWMMPRLQRFRDDLPGIDLRLQTSDRDLDLLAENIPLGVRGGDPEQWPEYGALALAEEEIFAVASPAYSRDHGAPHAPADLARHRLIHLDEPFRQASDWGDWFASAGLDPLSVPKGLVINDYALVIQAAMEGQGIALGWRHLTERLLAAGLLVQVAGHVLRTPITYCVIWPKAEGLSPQARAVRDWLIAQR
ncbi:MAG TPA: LysR substrate-binding domain-containing protein [Mesorhizobium sp.]|jgi:DNA-binding transcriptional LysR family regulator|nr:LysR substrate-binding domain-containing protein [Mesorhizobium sp.]